VNEICDGAVSFGVGFEMAAERVPGTEVVPFKSAIGDDDILGVFHQRVVNRDTFDVRIFFCEDFVEFGGVRGDFEPSLAGGVHLGLMLLKALGDGHEGPNEHSGVPAVLTAVQIFEGLVEMGFLDELFGTMENGFVALDALRWWQGLANLDVTVAGSGLGGFNADGDNGLAAAG